MAKRPIFISNLNQNLLYKEELINFDWHAGYSVAQKQKSIYSLHSNAKEKFGLTKILEISTKSDKELGIALSAFNLMISIDKKTQISVEAAYQGSKVFENGSPFLDLFGKSPFDVKKDERIRNSGNLLYFKFKRTKWALTPRTAYYDWLYITALSQNPILSDNLLNYDAFTDIVFNPEFSINCQARAAAIFVSLKRQKLFSKSILSKNNFIKLYDREYISLDGQLKLFN